MASFSNGRGIAHGGSNGMSVVATDVCKTPTSGGPVPIPYPNVGKSSDASQGPTTVSVECKTPMVKGAKYGKSSGDAAGSVGGVVSGTTQATCEFSMYSFDVKIEGRNVCRLGDPLFHNQMNTPGGVETGEPVATSAMPAARPFSPAHSTVKGTLQTAAGPLKGWPFTLRRNGRPVDKASLGGKSSNTFSNGAWLSKSDGTFNFSDLPAGCYSIEIELLDAVIPPSRGPTSPAPQESGARSRTPGQWYRSR